METGPPPRDQEVVGDDYDEEADSDFDASASDDGSISTDDENNSQSKLVAKQKKSKEPLIEQLDSGDEATIQKHVKKTKNKTSSVRKKDADDDNDEWRAKTRSMRAQEKTEKKRANLAGAKVVTVDINKIWEELNRPGPLPPVRIEGQEELQGLTQKTAKELTPAVVEEEMIVIRRQFKFAGEVHMEEKTVAKSSAEAQLWLAQQAGKITSTEQSADGKLRPLRKISRFDPNYANLEAFRNHAIKVQPDAFKGPKLNVVEKSKMDWAVHVDAEGLKDELSVAAKAKDAYLNRMDFLGQVEQRREDDAREARQKG